MRTLGWSLLLCLVSTTCLMANDEQRKQPIAGWGLLIDPDGDCSAEASGESLTLKFGPGSHGLDAEKPGAMNAPRVVQTFQEDFCIQVTVNGQLPLPPLDGNRTNAYISGGLVLIQNDQNYIRLERATFTRNGTIWHYTNFEQRVDAKRTRMGRFADYPLENDEPAQLRLEVRGDVVRALVRQDGDWHEMGRAKIYDRAEVLAGISGVKTDQAGAEVGFRELVTESGEFRSVQTGSESDIDLHEMRQLMAASVDAKDEWKTLMTEVLEFQTQCRRLRELSQAEQAELIQRGLELGTRRTPKRDAYLGLSMARRLANDFLEMGDREQAIHVYRAFAEKLESLRAASLKSSVKALREAAQELQGR